MQAEILGRRVYVLKKNIPAVLVPGIYIFRGKSYPEEGMQISVMLPDITVTSTGIV